MSTTLCLRSWASTSGAGQRSAGKEGSAAALALSKETRKTAEEGRGRALGARQRAARVRAASIARGGSASPPGRPARARVSCAAAEMAGARALVAACCCWWWLTTAAGEYAPAGSPPPPLDQLFFVPVAPAVTCSPSLITTCVRFDNRPP
ncbi:hypothetical protein ACJJTC_007050 [Scirpophaga incertulas]